LLLLAEDTDVLKMCEALSDDSTPLTQFQCASCIMIWKGKGYLKALFPLLLPGQVVCKGKDKGVSMKFIIFLVPQDHLFTEVHWQSFQ